MAIVEKLSDLRLSEIAGAIGRRFGPTSLFRFGRGPRLTESFPLWIWNLGTEAEFTSLREMAEPTGAWHHQVKEGGSVNLIARTLETRSEDAGELLFARTVIAGKIDRAISWADKNIGDDWEARLLFIPSLLTHAMWFEKDHEDRLYIIDAPTAALDEGSEARPQMILEKVQVLGGGNWERQ